MATDETMGSARMQESMRQFDGWPWASGDLIARAEDAEVRRRSAFDLELPLDATWEEIHAAERRAAGI